MSTETDIQKQADAYFNANYHLPHTETEEEKADNECFRDAAIDCYIAGYMSRDADIAAIKAENAIAFAEWIKVSAVPIDPIYSFANGNWYMIEGGVEHYTTVDLYKIFTDQNSKHEKD